MNVIVKCWTPENYDAVSHAVIPVTMELIRSWKDKIETANQMAVCEKRKGHDFSSLKYDDYHPEFVKTTAEELELTDEEFDELDDGGYHILPAKFNNHTWDEIGMRPCVQMVIAGDGVEPMGRISWYGTDKHGDAGCRSETYELDYNDLTALQEKLGEYKYTVEVKEVHSSSYEIKSEVPLTRDECIVQAKALVEEGQDELCMEYDRTLDEDEWTVRSSAGDYYAAMDKEKRENLE